MVDKKQQQLLLLILGFAVAPCFGQTMQIDWGSSAVVDKIITSDGSAITLAEFSVELGAFTDGFVPTEGNVSEWVDHWRVFDAITVGDSDTNGRNGASGDGFISGGGTSAFFAGTAHLQSDQTSASEDANGIDTFGPSQQAYVFIRNGDYPTTSGSGVEWLLYTNESANGWTYPDVSPDSPNIPQHWSALNADEAVWGAVNGSVVGGGIHTDASSDFLLRTHTIVPELSTFFLSLLGIAPFFRRVR